MQKFGRRNRLLFGIATSLLLAMTFGPTIIAESTQEFGGTGQLFVNGKKVAEQEMPRMHIATYSLAETFDIGRDTGTQVSRIYDDPFVFTGELDRVTIQLND